MAFSTAGGYGNLPNGNFSPIIYSKQVQLAFRKSSVVEAITNSDYFGEIAQMGDSVKIIKEPEITVKSYARGTTITPQDLDDEDFSLTIDKANYFAFKVDDIEEAHSHVNFQSLASDRAAYRLADQMDHEVRDRHGDHLEVLPDEEAREHVGHDRRHHRRRHRHHRWIVLMIFSFLTWSHVEERFLTFQIPSAKKPPQKKQIIPAKQPNSDVYLFR